MRAGAVVGGTVASPERNARCAQLATIYESTLTDSGRATFSAVTLEQLTMH